MLEDIFSKNALKKVISLRHDLHEIEGIKESRDTFIRSQFGDLGEMM